MYVFHLLVTPNNEGRSIGKFAMRAPRDCLNNLNNWGRNKLSE